MHISTLPIYLIFKNIPPYPLIRASPFIKHLRVDRPKNLLRLLRLMRLLGLFFDKLGSREARPVSSTYMIK